MAEKKVYEYKSSSVKRKDLFYLDFDTTNFLKQFEKKAEDFNGRGGAFERAMQRMIPLVKQDFSAFIQQHEHSGITERSLMDENEAILKWGKAVNFKIPNPEAKQSKKVNKTKNVLSVIYGFKLEEGTSAGEAAIFLDVGRPGIKYKNGNTSKPMTPTYFVYYTIEKNMRKFNEIFREEVMKELGGLL